MGGACEGRMQRSEPPISQSNKSIGKKPTPLSSFGGAVAQDLSLLRCFRENVYFEVIAYSGLAMI